jgi:hypothetical protein
MKVFVVLLLLCLASFSYSEAHEGSTHGDHGGGHATPAEGKKDYPFLLRSGVVLLLPSFCFLLSLLLFSSGAGSAIPVNVGMLDDSILGSFGVVSDESDNVWMPTDAEVVDILGAGTEEVEPETGTYSLFLFSFSLFFPFLFPQRFHFSLTLG